MVEHHRDEPVKGDELDRALEALLNVEPSPDFVARVRADVSADAIAADWLTGRLVAMAAAVGAVMVGVWLFMGTQATPPLPAAPIVAQRLPSAPGIAPVEPAVNPPVKSTPIAQTIAAAPSAPDVVVSPREFAGLQYLLAALRDERLDSAVMPGEQSDAADTPIVIEPLTVEPLVAAADLETGASQ